MTNEEALRRLTATRHLRSDEEFFEFENVLTFLGAHPDPSNLPSLYLALDDDCDQDEVMFGLVHFVEYFDLETHLRAFLSVMPTLIGQAPRWTRILTCRILNNEAARVCYKGLLRLAPAEEKAVAYGVLEEIVAGGKAPLGERARFVLDS